jgi:hypothetical protein
LGREILRCAQDDRVEARVWLVAPMVPLSLGSRAGYEGSEGCGARGREILRCAQDDRVRSLKLMTNGADKSGLEMHYATFGYASLWLMQRGDGHGEPAPTLSLRLFDNN